MTMVGGLIVLLPALRIKGSYFALVTLAFMELMYQLTQVVRPDLTGGTRGISGIEALTRGAVQGYYLAFVVMFSPPDFQFSTVVLGRIPAGAGSPEVRKLLNSSLQ